MSILGYSTSYYLPEYWSTTPLYGEQIVALLDDVLSLNYSRSDQLAEVYYTIANKYKNTGDLSIDVLEEIINESGYGYIRDLFGDDPSSLLKLIYLLPMVHQYKGTKAGLELVLNLLRMPSYEVAYSKVGNPTETFGEVSNFTSNDYACFKGIKTDDLSFELNFKIITGTTSADQCIVSLDKYGFCISLTKYGTLSLSLGNDKKSWNIADNIISTEVVYPNKTYFIKFSFNGSKYSLNVSENGIEYSEYVVVESSETLNIHSGKLFIGVNGSSSIINSPFKGSINKDSVNVSLDNVKITEWFEEFPVGYEDTYRVRTDVDMDLVNTDFFEKFWEFSSRYLYPTLSSFEATLPYDAALTVIHYSKQHIKYVCEGTYGMNTHFEVKKANIDDEWEEFKTKFGNAGNLEFFDTVIPKDELN